MRGSTRLATHAPEREPAHERDEHRARRVRRRAEHVREVLVERDLVDEPERAGEPVEESHEREAGRGSRHGFFLSSMSRT